MRLTHRVVLSFTVGIFMVAPSVAHAQIGGTLGKILGGIARAGGPPPPIQIIGRPQVQGGDSAIVALLRTDTSTVRTLATVPCGTQRLCAPGADLRVVSVTLPAPEIMAGIAIPVTVTVENHGRATAAASEVQLCSGDVNTPCARKLELVPLASLASGERIALTRRVMSGDAGYGLLTFTAVIDPDNVATEANRSNNTGASTPVHVVGPQLAIVGMQVAPETAPDGTEQISVAIRNPSQDVPSPRTQLCIVPTATVSNCGAQSMIDFPSLAPRQAISFTARVRVVDGPGKYGYPYLQVTIDPQHQYNWRDTEQNVRSTQYRVTPVN